MRIFQIQYDKDKLKVNESLKFRFGYVHGIIIVEKGRNSAGLRPFFFKPITQKINKT